MKEIFIQMDPSFFCFVNEELLDRELAVSLLIGVNQLLTGVNTLATGVFSPVTGIKSFIGVNQP